MIRTVRHDIKYIIPTHDTRINEHMRKMGGMEIEVEEYHRNDYHYKQTRNIYGVTKSSLWAWREEWLEPLNNELNKGIEL